MPADSANSRSDRSRYPGTRPFGDTADDHALFFGRDGEGEQIYLRVLSVPLLVQFGRSGLGKTSLLQASLFPRLRQKAFLPVMVRFNVTSESPTDAVARAIEESSRQQGLELTLGRSGSLRELVATTTVWREDLLLTFVLVFDQFEEVFTLRDVAFRERLAAELAALLSEEKRERLEETAPTRPGATSPRVDVKVVISLREDFLGALEEFSGAIPGVFHERLRLEPLGEEAACEAIRRPAELTLSGDANAFSVCRFEFEPAALSAMIDYLKGNSGVIEPFQLQLLCRHAEAIAARKVGASGEAVRLTLNDIQGREGFDAVLKNFYKNTLLRIERSERSTAARLCEEGLLDASGHRLMLEEGQIRRDFHISDQCLATLSRERLLRRERRLDSAFYEISHDRLAESILRAKRFRLPKPLRRVLWGTAIVAPIILVMAIWWGLSTHKHQQRMNYLLGVLLGNVLEDARNSGLTRTVEVVESNLGEVGDISHWSPLNRGRALRNRGDIKRKHGSLTGAIDLFKEAINALEGGPQDAQRQREVARTRDSLAEALSDQGHITEALANYEEEAKAWLALVQENPIRDDCTSLADSLVSRADIRRRMGDTPGAFKDMEEASKIISSVLFRYSAQDGCGKGGDAPEIHPDAKALQVLSRVARLRAVILNYREDYDATVALQAEAWRLNPTSVDTRENMLVALAWRGNGRLDTPDRALADYRAALAGFDELRLWDPNNRQWERERAASQILIGSGILACNSGQKGPCNPSPSLADAEATYWDAIATLRSLISGDESNLSWKADLAWALESEAAVMAADEPKRNDERLGLLEGATNLMSHILVVDKLDGDSAETYARILYEKADALSDLNRLAEARESIEKSVTMFTNLASAHPDDPAYVADLSAARKSESGVLQKAGDAKGSAASKTMSDELLKKYQGLSGGESQRTGDLAVARNKHVNEGAALFNKGDYAGAIDKFNEAEADGRAYFALRPTRQAGYHELSNIYRWLHTTEDKLGRNKEAALPLNAALRSTQIEALLAPDNARQHANETLVAAWQEIGVFLHNNSHPKDALPIVQEQVAAAELLLQTDTRNAKYQWGLGNVRCGLGMVRRENKKDGWEEAIRLGIRQISMASEIDPKNPAYLAEVGEWHKYLGDELESDRRKEEASTEYKLARQSYENVLRRFPKDERARKGMAELGQLGRSNSAGGN
jgi:tetratricopeptide (TPR) repeat protein